MEVLEDSWAERPFVSKWHKDWESPYDPKLTKGTGRKRTASTPPDVKSLPLNRWVIPRHILDADEAHEFWTTMRDWLATNKIKYQEIEAISDGKKTIVY